MARKNQVLRSIDNETGSRCVDLFVRPNGTVGFEEYRRDPEDGRGWFPVGSFGHRVFESEAEALREARARIPWLNPAVDGGRPT